MINLSTQLCENLGLTYWQLKQADDLKQIHTISRDEKELLRKIMLAKGIKLEEKMLSIEQRGKVTVSLDKYQLIFDDVSKTDTNSTIHLAAISAMQQDPEQKKRTWYKLKHLDL
ncbi:MAG TPA: hypothetical protein ENJ41_08835 [Oceanospirillales bacterium]|nr:hypothetical protein [Oceanospirillales bacterium]